MTEAPKKLSLTFDNMFNPEAIDANEEVLVQIIRANFHVKEGDESGKTSLRLTLRAANNPKAQLITEYMGWPSDEEQEALEALNNGAELTADMQEKAQVCNSKLLRLQRFCKCFGIEHLDWDLSNPNENFLVGQQAYVVVDREEPNEFSDEPRNRVKRWGGQG